MALRVSTALVHSATPATKYEEEARLKVFVFNMDPFSATKQKSIQETHEKIYLNGGTGKTDEYSIS